MHPGCQFAAKWANYSYHFFARKLKRARVQRAKKETKRIIDENEAQHVR